MAVRGFLDPKTSIAQRAEALARRMHVADQSDLRVRLGMGTTIDHVSRVVKKVLEARHRGVYVPEWFVAAMWLHDVVEDTSVTLWRVMRDFGFFVWVVVWILTDPPRYKDLPEHERKRRQYRRLWLLSCIPYFGSYALFGKTCDAWDNHGAIRAKIPDGWDLKKGRTYVAWCEHIMRLGITDTAWFLDTTPQTLYVEMGLSPEPCPS